MIVVALACLASQSFSGVFLTRGGSGDEQFLYWAVEDTYLDAAAPDSNFGRDGLLTGGDGKTILIKFGDLDRMLGGKRVKTAKLVFQIEIGRNPKLRSIGRVQAPWGEGGDRRGFNIRRTPVVPGKKPTGPLWNATWKHRRSGENPIGWQSPGASGAADVVPIEGATVDFTESTLTISGLQVAVQGMADRWYENHGFALRFDTPIDLASSDALTGRPQLHIEFDESPDTAGGGDLSVESLVPTGFDPAAWPANGASIPWTATVRNVGTTPVTGFGYRWWVRERDAEEGRSDQTLAPGATATFTVNVPFRVSPDHRTMPAMFRVTAQGDTNPHNDALSVATNGVPVTVVVRRPDLEAVTKQARDRGFASLLDTLQADFRFWNDTLCAQSKFSFAPEGTVERFRLESLAVVDPGSAWGGQGASIEIGPKDDLRTMLFQASRSVGVPDWRPTQFAPSAEKPPVVAGTPVFRGGRDPFPGLMGGGDTRDEGLFPNTLSLIAEPWADPVADATPLFPTDLYSSADVAVLQALIGVIGPQRNEIARGMPRSIIVRAFDGGNRPMPNTTLAFYQLNQGAVPAEATFTVTTNGNALATLPLRETSPFGTIAPDWGNAAFLVRVEANSAVEWVPFKAWQALATASRGAPLTALRFNLVGAPVDPSGNLAKGKIVADSADTLPAKLGALVDDDPSTTVELPAAASSWVEIDLGRDRAIGEVRLELPSGTVLWPQFDVMLYATGQRAAEARLFASERNPVWSLANRAEPDPRKPGTQVLSYRGIPGRARYIRLVPRAAAPGPVTIAELRISPLKVE